MLTYAGLSEGAGTLPPYCKSIDDLFAFFLGLA
jgi:hypothetical protein